MATTSRAPAPEGHARRQLFVIVALLVGMYFVYRFAQFGSQTFDPSGMLSLGFIIFACYAIGNLVGTFGLPHITGYLIAGFIFGPSLAELLSLRFDHVPPPFARGILNPQVLDQLSLFDTLAVALIALTAGGELKLDALKKGFRAILSILGLQLIAVIGAVTVFFLIVSGTLPYTSAIALPGMGGLSLPAAAAVGVMVATIAFATSPAATIAVITETGATGPMSRTVLSTVVLKDVIVVIAFAVAQVVVGYLLGRAAIEGGLGAYLAEHILGSIAVGFLVGGMMALYVRYVAQEILVFIVGTVFLTSYVAQQLHWDAVLLFLAAGFGVSNFSKSGHKLIESVERLSLPVYVVFFTLAGARLHFDELIKVFGFAVALFLVRLGAIYVGTKGGAKLGRADEGTKAYGWLGFVSQAGVSISLAAIVGNRFGELGRSLETLIIAGVALNELFGPVALKFGLALAGEASRTERRGEPDSGHISVRPPATVAPSGNAGGAPKLAQWPAAIATSEVWGPPIVLQTRELNSRMQELLVDLQGVVRDIATGPLSDFRQEAERYLRDLRREFMRHHRRITAEARVREHDPEELAAALRSVQAELSDHWRGIVLGRSITLGKQSWSPASAVEVIDSMVDALPEVVKVPFEPESYEDREGQTAMQSLRRSWLRTSRKLRDALGQPPPQRDVRLRALARFHVSYDAPAKLEGLAALFVEADRHLAARTRSVFDGIVAGYDEMASRVGHAPIDLEAQLAQLRQDVELELNLAFEDVRRISDDGTRRAAQALGGGIVAMKRDLPIFGTLDLPPNQRRSSRRFADRIRAIETLTEDLASLKRASAAEYSMLAMELELMGLEARVREAVEEQITRLATMVQRRAIMQAERVDEAVSEATAEVEGALLAKETGEELAATLRKINETISKAISEASGVTSDFFDSLGDDTNIAPLLDSLVEACRGLTPRYVVVAGQRQTGEWRLPAALPEIEVPFQEAVLTYVESRAAPKILISRHALAERIQPLAKLLEELERIIAFNVELATTELEVVHDEPVPEELENLLRETLTSQMERNHNLLRELLAHAPQWSVTMADDMREAVLGTLNALREDLAAGSFSRSQLEAMRRAATGMRVTQAMGKLPGRVERFSDQISRGLRAWLGEEGLEEWRQRLGFVSKTPAEELSAGLFAAPGVSAELPLVYRRLFAADTMEAGDVLTGRDEEIQRAEAVLSSEARGRLRSVVLVGIDGVGKAAVVSAIVRTGRWKNIRRVAFQGPVTVEEVEAIFQDKPEGQLVVVDGLHWMLSMAPGGFEPLRRFVSGIISEGGRRRWLTHANVLFWNFAATVAPLRDAFPEIIRLQPLSPEALQAAVIARHRLSGYEHAFDRGEGSSRLEKIIARGASRIRGPYDRYFQELHEATGGVVRDSLRLWLASIREIRGGEIVCLGPVPGSAYAKLNRLPEDIIVNLYQLARQGWLDAAGQARLFRVDASTAQAQLSRLAHLGLLEEKQGAFRIVVHLRGALGRIFAERGWVQ